MGKKNLYKVPDAGFKGFQGEYIIPVMGATGAGKSTFINRLLGAELAEVGESLGSCTRELKAFHVPLDIIARRLPQWRSAEPDKQLVIVDTPGFDDTDADDSEILQRIADWLARTYGAEAKLAGVLYLHEILADRFSGSRKRNFKVFKKLCGANNCRSVVLGTTKWELVGLNSMPKMERRQKELQDVHWKEMTAGGSTVQRVDETPDSAWKLVETVLNSDKLYKLRIQAELVELGMLLPETDAANVLREEIKQRIESLKRAGATKEEVQTFLEAVAKLKPSFASRLRSFFHFF